MADTDLTSFSATIERLAKKGVRWSTVVDIGCADGQFFLDDMRWFEGAVPVNIDASPIYEESLKAIKEVVGGHYRICAITDHVGEIEFTESVHPYWSSVRAAGDLYWSRVNDLTKTTVKVPATTLDTLAGELALKPPFLIKLDVQGAELAALAGGRRVLEETTVVIVEADIDDFQAINSALVASGFELYDLTVISRVEDGTLGWFYPVYVSKKLNVQPVSFWDAKNNDLVISIQDARRQANQKAIAEMLNRVRYRHANVGRNDPCPCNSGRKFRLCCGSYQA
jgi:FkbM family methyltransferase